MSCCEDNRRFKPVFQVHDDADWRQVTIRKEADQATYTIDPDLEPDCRHHVHKPHNWYTWVTAVEDGWGTLYDALLSAVRAHTGIKEFSAHIVHEADAWAYRRDCPLGLKEQTGGSTWKGDPNCPRCGSKGILLLESYVCDGC